MRWNKRRNNTLFTHTHLYRPTSDTYSSPILKMQIKIFGICTHINSTKCLVYQYLMLCCFCGYSSSTILYRFVTARARNWPKRKRNIEVTHSRKMYWLSRFFFFLFFAVKYFFVVYFAKFKFFLSDYVRVFVCLWFRFHLFFFFRFQFIFGTLLFFLSRSVGIAEDDQHKCVCMCVWVCGFCFRQILRIPFLGI